MNNIGNRISSILPIAGMETSICRPMPARELRAGLEREQRQQQRRHADDARRRDLAAHHRAASCRRGEQGFERLALALARGRVDDQVRATEERTEDQQVRQERHHHPRRASGVDRSLWVTASGAADARIQPAREQAQRAHLLPVLLQRRLDALDRDVRILARAVVHDLHHRRLPSCQSFAKSPGDRTYTSSHLRADRACRDRRRMPCDGCPARPGTRRGSAACSTPTIGTSSGFSIWLFARDSASVRMPEHDRRREQRARHQRQHHGARSRMNSRSSFCTIVS
jgi:hypothetical protein